MAWIIQPSALRAYCERIDRTVGEAEARERMLFELARAKPLDRPQRDGSALYRGPGPDRVQYRVRCDGSAMMVVDVLLPHARWTPRTAPRGSGRVATNGLGKLLADQRARTQLTVDELAALADVEVEALQRAEAGDGIDDRGLRALCNAMRVELTFRSIG